MVKISPSILSASFQNLGAELEAVTAAGADLLHLDVMDGVFVPNITFGPAVLSSIQFPKGVQTDAHLMITQPENHIDAFLKLKLDRIAVHVESTIHLQRLLKYMRDGGTSPGVAINPSTSLSTLEWVLDDVDLVVVMTVNPGFGGQSFIPSILPKVAQLKEMITKRGLKTEIEVDGGVNPKNIRSLIDAGMDIAVAGSAVFNQPDYAQAIRDLKNA